MQWPFSCSWPVWSEVERALWFAFSYLIWSDLNASFSSLVYFLRECSTNRKKMKAASTTWLYIICFSVEIHIHRWSMCNGPYYVNVSLFNLILSVKLLSHTNFQIGWFFCTLLWITLYSSHIYYHHAELVKCRSNWRLRRRLHIQRQRMQPLPIPDLADFFDRSWLVFDEFSSASKAYCNPF